MTGAAAATAADAAWVALGANLGERRAALAALRGLLAGDGVHLEAASPELVTRAVGVERQPDFRNQVVLLRADAPRGPAAWLAHLRAAEHAAGRRPTYRWGPRRADADLLLLGRDGQVRVATADLTVPHPGLGDRPFLCALLAAVAPDLRHPDGWRFADRAGHLLGGPPGAV